MLVNILLFICGLLIGLASGFMLAVVAQCTLESEWVNRGIASIGGKVYRIKRIEGEEQ